MATSAANPDVLAFYRSLPFNLPDKAESDVRMIRRQDLVALYPPLPALLARKGRVLEVGCGTGWLANAMAYRYPVAVTALDFNSVALDRARAVAAALGRPVDWREADLFLYRPEEPFDVVVSFGVLHHTNDCLGAIDLLCRHFCRPGGSVVIGLYHAQGRRPFLDHFRALRAGGASEADLLEAYRRLDTRFHDETMLMSWFRDQVLHPHETQHSLRQVLPVLEAAGMVLAGTSINGFGPIPPDLEELYAAEDGLFQVGRQRLAQGQYFPGFFVVHARKPAAVPAVGLVPVPAPEPGVCPPS